VLALKNIKSCFACLKHDNQDFSFRLIFHPNEGFKVLTDTVEEGKVATIWMEKSL